MLPSSTVPIHRAPARRAPRGYTVLLAVWLAAGPASHAYAQPAARESVTPSAAGGDPNGAWIGVVSQANGLELRVPLRVSADREGRWVLNSRPGAMTPLIGRWRALVGRILGKLPPHGALLTGGGRATAAGDGTLLRGTLSSPLLGRVYFVGVVAGGRLVGDLRRDSAGATVGRLTATPGAGDVWERPVQDYRARAADIRTSFAARLYDPRLLEQPAWQRFFRDLDARFADARDDADAMAAFYALRPRLPVSHIEFVRSPSLAATPIDSLLAGRGDPNAYVRLTFPAPGVALLRVTRWEAVAGAVDRAFARIDSAGVRTLVLDMRGNEGGDVSAMAPATHLLRDSAPAGVFLGRGWYAAHAAPPTAAELRGLPILTDGDVAGARQLMRLVAERGAAAGRVVPRAPRFDGEVYLLVDRRSASASEPLAHVLKARQRATLVGEPTAGAMLMAPPRPLSDGWVLVLPEADYVTAEGIRLEGHGVAPDVAVPSQEALVTVAERLRTTSLATAPYAGALLLGAANQETGRLVEAERWYRTARELAPDSIAPSRGLAVVFAQRQAWDSAAAACDAVLARDPDDRTALYQLGRAAALSGRFSERGAEALRRYLAQPWDPALPSHAVAQWRLGIVLARSGATTEARQAYEAALRLDPTLAEARTALQTLGRGRS